MKARGPVSLCGKLIVGDSIRLSTVRSQAEANGVPVAMLSPRGLRAMEVAIRPGLHGLLSPNTEVIDPRFELFKIQWSIYA